MQTDNPWASLLGMIVSVAVVTGLAYWFTRCVIGGNRFKSLGLLQKNEQLQVLTQTQIGKEQKVAVIQAGMRYFLLGVTAQNISLLAELSKEEASIWQHQQGEEGSESMPHFHQALVDALQKRKKR